MTAWDWGLGISDWREGCQSASLSPQEMGSGLET